MKKNMKKIIIFCLYNILALSTIDLICAEKRKLTTSSSLNSILNVEENVSLPTSTQLVNEILRRKLENSTTTNSIVLSRSGKKKYITNEIKKIKTHHVCNC